MDTLWIFLPGILALGLITSYEDIKIGKIRNKWTGYAFIYSLLAYAILIAYSLIFESINISYMLELFTNLAFASVLGFLLWYFGVWTAGDGKLFIAFSFMIPFDIYVLGYEKWFPSFTLLTNIFLCALLIVLLIIVSVLRIKYVKDSLKIVFKEFFNLKSIIKSVASLFAIYWLIQIIFNLVGLDSYVFRMILTIAFFSSIRNLGKGYSYLLIALSITRLVIDRSIYNLDFLTEFLIIVIVWGIIFGFFQSGLYKLSSVVFSRAIEPKYLKPGMVLTECIEKKKLSVDLLKELKAHPEIKIIKRKGVCYIKKPKGFLSTGSFVDEESEGLTLAQIKEIQNLGFKQLRVSQTIPFAPFIFAGVILTIIAKGNILIFIMKLVS